ncbi:MAG: imidazole glycerol phosphate synthase subunit HisH [Desulfosalsimonadaceae bacterium]|nr:imidazole glycerol phosphate synthase subunit HisH [Desulfosalsimonadaceae bacterium]
MIAIIDYKAGNLASVSRAFSHIGVENIITNDIRIIESAERVVFPGVGAAGSAMKSLIRLGLDKALRHALDSGKPVLGICLGTQIILQTSQENQTLCLGLIDGCARAFSESFKSGGITGLKIPHMGWNRITLQADHPVFAGIRPDDEFYFVHSYYPSPDHANQVIATTEYGIIFPSVIGMKNLVATQFHPEKSGKPGLRILKNFSGWSPC